MNSQIGPLINILKMFIFQTMIRDQCKRNIKNSYWRDIKVTPRTRGQQVLMVLKHVKSTV